MVESLTIIPVECVNCGHEVKTDFDSIEQRKMLKCSECGTSFHINDVYDLYYDEESLVKNAVDLIISYAKQPWRIEAKQEEHLKAIEAFLKKVGFDSLLERILSDVVKYGDSYLEIIRDSDTKEIIELRPLEAKTVSLKLGQEIRHGRAYTGEREVEEFVVSDGASERRLTPTDVIHSKTRTFSLYAPYGESVMRIALKYMYYLRTTRMNALRQGAEWWVNYLEDGICLGIGVPRILLDKGYAKYGKPIVEMASTYFIGSVKDAQGAIENSFERQLFGQLIGVEDFREIPRLEFKKLDSTTILRNGGYDFSEEIKTWKQLLDLKIISEEEYRGKLSEFLGKL